MYLAQKKTYGRRDYCLRESYEDGDRIAFRELFDLGEDPSDYIVYPGGNGFYFNQTLTDALADQGVANVDRELELIFFRFLPHHIQRIIEQMTHLGRKKRPDLSKEAMARAQARLHLFDRRRFFFLRFGRMDSLKTIMRPHRFLNVLTDKSRDEIEHFFQDMEKRLRIREKKQYIYQALDLQRYFPGELSRLFPMGLDQIQLDEAFTTEICQLNQDPSYRDPDPDQTIDPTRLCEYLINYAILWFDFDFGQRPPQSQLFDEFVRSRAGFKPPPPPPAVDLSDALACFGLQEQEWRNLTREDLARRYRRLAMECHPDQGGDSDQFVDLNMAYERLLEEK